METLDQLPRQMCCSRGVPPEKTKRKRGEPPERSKGGGGERERDDGGEWEEEERKMFHVEAVGQVKGGGVHQPLEDVGLCPFLSFFLCLNIKNDTKTISLCSTFTPREAGDVRFPTVLCVLSNLRLNIDTFYSVLFFKLNASLNH